MVWELLIFLIWENFWKQSKYFSKWRDVDSIVEHFFYNVIKGDVTKEQRERHRKSKMTKKATQKLSQGGPKEEREMHIKQKDNRTR